ncbi:MULTISPECIES: hypothetical protein [Halolamina]|uniref:Uncharacterized protein n=1 Tax=Halolamina pelagica TaxID=699431 RepID=A0A1I5NJP6_9EURY|nr:MULTISPECIES: hypothetical protein [Halolamina]NHX36352.1 hypothetical protein [Halolamina sp. R1-12]SFP22045.1 hypothetical protein SAMN05216277_10266 [Halolamina pelagica]
MPAVGALFALLVVLSIAGTIGLWYAIDGETDDTRIMSRGDAERAARKDTDENGADTGANRDRGADTAWSVDDREGDDAR